MLNKNVKIGYKSYYTPLT